MYVLVAHKLKKSLSAISEKSTIKELVGGKSTLQNEILGDLGAEFGNVFGEKVEEATFSEIISLLTVSHNGILGKISSTLINKMIGSKMPAGFGMSQIKSYLGSSYGLGSGRIDALLLHALLKEPASRLGSEADAKKWIGDVANEYAARANISFTTLSKGASSQSTSTVNSEDFLKLQSKLQKHIRSQLELYAKFVDFDLLEASKNIANESTNLEMMQTQLDIWSIEHGNVYMDGIRPAFNVKKARKFDSYWNWARQDVLELYYDFVFGRLTSVDRDLMNRCVHLMNRTEDVESIVQLLEFYVNNCDEKMGENYERVKLLGRVLIENCQAALESNPVYKNCTIL